MPYSSKYVFLHPFRWQPKYDSISKLKKARICLTFNINFIVQMRNKEILLLIFTMTQFYNSKLILNPDYIEIDTTYKYNSQFTNVPFAYSEGSKSIFSMREQGILSLYQINSTGFYNLAQTINVQPGCWNPLILVNDDRTKIFIDCVGSGASIGYLVNGAYSFRNTSVTGIDQIEQISKDGQYVLWSRDATTRMISKDVGSNNYVHYVIPNSPAQDTFCFIYDSTSLILFSSDKQLKQYNLSTIFSNSTVFLTYNMTGLFLSQIYKNTGSYKFLYNTGKTIIFSTINSQYQPYLLLLVFKNGNWEITQCIQPYKMPTIHQDLLVTSPYGTVYLRINQENIYIYRYNPNKWIYQYQVTLKSIFSNTNMIAVSQDGTIFVDNQFLYQITYPKTNANSSNSSSGSNTNNSSTVVTEHRIDNNVTFQMDTTWVIIGFTLCNLFLLALIILVAKHILCKTKQPNNVIDNDNDAAQRKEFLRSKDENKNSTIDKTQIKEFMSVEREKYLNKNYNQIGLGKSLMGQAEVVDLKEIIKQ